MNTQIIIDNLELRGGDKIRKYWHIKGLEGKYWLAIRCNCHDSRGSLYGTYESDLIIHDLELSSPDTIFRFIHDDESKTLPEMIAHLECEKPKLKLDIRKHLNELQNQIDELRDHINGKHRD